MRALIYCRVSKDERHGRSVGEQEAECRAECAAEGWEVVEVVTDNDVGASRYSKGQRPGWRRVLAMVEAGEVDVLVTWEGSRAQRDLEKYAALRGLCLATGVRWHYGGRTYDMANWKDRRDTGRDAVDDEAESGRTSERIRRTTRASAVNGRPHGRRLFGYQRTYDPTTGALTGQTEHPSEGPVVRRIFDTYLSGVGIRTIARQLNADGVTTGTGAAWNDSQVRRVLLNPAYAARRVHRGELVGDANWPPLVDRDRFARATARLGEWPRRRNIATARLLTGVARCGVCGSRMQVGHDRGHRKVYQCRAGFHVARDEARLDAYVTERLLAKIAEEDREPETPARDDSEARELRGRLDEATAHFTRGNLSAATLAKIEADLLPRIRAAETPAPVIAVEVDVPTDTPLEDWWRGLTPAVRREIANAWIAAVVVGPTRRGRRVFDPDAIDVQWRT